MSTITRFALLLGSFTISGFGQSAPAYFPDTSPNPKQYANLTAARSPRLPAGWHTKENWGRLQRLRPLASKAKPAIPKPGLTPTGEARMLDAGALTGWQSKRLPDGRIVWRTAIQSPGARGLRLHFQNFASDQQSMWIYPQGESHEAPSILGPFDQRGPNGDGEFWTGTIFGDTAVIEIESTSLTEPPAISPDKVAHLYGDSTTAIAPVAEGRTARPAFQLIPRAGTTPPAATAINAAACEVDSTCYPQYNPLASATLHFQFQTEDGFTYVCSGAMINTRSSSRRPYVATANHCISSDSQARSVEAFFSYASRTCDAKPVFREDAFRVSGARYMAGGGWSNGDFALLLLNSAPPTGTAFLGWNAADMPFNTSFVGLHYPRGSWRRIAIGSRRPDENARIEGQLAPAQSYYQMAYSLGLTESGSSGSPILNEAGQIYGTLSYGPVPPSGRTICDFNVQTAAYGRFSSAIAAYRPFLDDEAPPSLTLSSSSVSFNVESGAVVGAASSNITLRSAAAAAATFSASTTAAWLRVRTSATQVSISAPATITVEIDPRTLTVPGQQTANVTITSGTLVPLNIAVVANVVNRASTVSLSVNPNPVLQTDPDTDGFTFFYTLSVAETAGVATQLTSLSIGGTNLSARISEWFGSSSLNANSTLQVALRGRNITVPSEVIFTVGGVDPGTSRTWTRTLSVPFQPKASRAQISLISKPSQVNELPSDPDCPWLQYMVVQELSGFPVRLTRLVADGDDLSADIENFFVSLDIPGRGSTVGGICWSGVRAPDIIELLVEGTDSAGNRIESRVSTRFVGPLASPASLSSSASEVLISALINRTSPLAPVQIPVNLNRATTPWTASLLFTQKDSAWLNAGPLSGTGPSVISLVPSLTGLSEGIYDATMFIESPQSQPQTLYIPITFTVVSPRPAPVLASGGVVPNATYRGALTAGSLASAFGTNLASGVDIAGRIPLPNTMGVTQVRVNGRIAPLLYTGENQINFQVPWETPTGTATLTVDVAGQSAQTSFPVTNINPGIYTSDGRQLVPERTASRSSIILAFVGGVGAVSPTVVTGDAPDFSLPVTGLPQPQGPVTATIAGIEARVFFSAIPYGLVGLMQVNLEVPPNAPLGEQPLVIRVGGIASPPAFLTVR
jgi:uncharacterized protein (TIGR03437 family)